VQAALLPALRDDAFTVPAVARVTFETAHGAAGPAANRYVFAAVLSLEEERPTDEQLPVDELARLSLPDYLDRRWDPAGEGGGLVLIIDQFEEVLTIDPTDIAAKREFFGQLGLALRNRNRWALLAMREEHVAGLDPYRNLVPTRLSATYRLELLDEHQAQQAMQAAAAQAGVESRTAARRLVDDLRRVRIDRPGQPAGEQLGPTVEPTQPAGRLPAALGRAGRRQDQHRGRRRRGAGAASTRPWPILRRGCCPAGQSRALRTRLDRAGADHGPWAARSGAARGRPADAACR
jgi:hypothetical protein